MRLHETYESRPVPRRTCRRFCIGRSYSAGVRLVGYRDLSRELISNNLL
jgi:hypothetical protein